MSIFWFWRVLGVELDRFGVSGLVFKEDNVCFFYLVVLVLGLKEILVIVWGNWWGWVNFGSCDIYKSVSIVFCFFYFVLYFFVFVRVLGLIVFWKNYKIG